MSEDRGAGPSAMMLAAVPTPVCVAMPPEDDVERVG